jgi:hypothetical protein
MTSYRALVGLSYPPDKHVEAGDIVSDLPEKSAIWLLSQDLIELADGKTTKKPVVKVEELKEEIPVIVEKSVDFKKDAIDGDGDGFVQDGTPFERLVEEK